MHDLVCWKILYIWNKGILGNSETALHSGILPGDPDWNDCRWTDVYCISAIDCMWHHCTYNI